MKIYTSQKSQFGRELLILNKVVKFDSFGSTEVEDNLGKDLIKCNPDWYSDKKFDFKEEIKVAENTTKEFNKKDEQIKELEEKIQFLSNVDSARKKEIEQSKILVEEFRMSLQKTTDEKKKAEEGFEIEVSKWKIEKEKLQYTIELMKMSKDELVQTAASLDITEKEYAGLKKDELIDVIVKKATEK